MADSRGQSFMAPFSLHPKTQRKKIGVVTAKWNEDITKILRSGCISVLEKYLKKENIVDHWVPGSFELPLAAQWLIEFTAIDAVICLGCLIKGETPHFQYISNSVSQKIGELNLKYNIPVIFGVLTTENKNQALDRAGGGHGHKGEEAAITALQMLNLFHEIKGDKKPLGFHQKSKPNEK